MWFSVHSVAGTVPPLASLTGGANHHMSGGTSGYPALSLNRRSDSGRSYPTGREKPGRMTHVMLASGMTSYT